MSRSLRRLHGVTYWVINDPLELSEFVNSNLRKEWERDCREDHLDPGTDEWLIHLSERAWRMATLDIAKIRLDPSLIARPDFTHRLDERSDELVRAITEYGAIVWPVVIRGEDHTLKDGHCRLMTMRKLGIADVLAYIGTRRKSQGHRSAGRNSGPARLQETH